MLDVFIDGLFGAAGGEPVRDDETAALIRLSLATVVKKSFYLPFECIFQMVKMTAVPK
jgi:hypothetical protein